MCEISESRISAILHVGGRGLDTTGWRRQWTNRKKSPPFHCPRRRRAKSRKRSFMRLAHPTHSPNSRHFPTAYLGSDSTTPEPHHLSCDSWPRHQSATQGCHHQRRASHICARYLERRRRVRHMGRCRFTLRGPSQRPVTLALTSRGPHHPRRRNTFVR
jgi:hypothetical protein